MRRGENAMTETFEEVTVLDRPMLFTCGRIDRATVPKGLYLQEPLNKSSGAFRRNIFRLFLPQNLEIHQVFLRFWACTQTKNLLAGLTRRFNQRFLYEVRHDDDQRGEPVEIAERILVNHWGTLLSSRPIRLLGAPGGKPYRLIDPDRDWNYEGVTSTVRQYLERHPLRKAKRRVEER